MFDPIAAFALQDTSTTAFRLNTFHSQHLLATFADGTALPDRAPFQPNPSPNAGSNTPDDAQANPLQVTFNLNGVTAPDGSAFPDDLVQFMAFSAQSQSHLNAQGLCYVVGQHASDPYFAPTITSVSQ